MTRARTKAPPKGLPKAPHQIMPEFVPPCLATLSASAPEGPLWVHEVKFDGYRLQVRIDDGTVQFLTRTGLDWSPRFAALAKPFKALKVKSAIIDGEAVVLDAKGASDFVMLVDALKAGKSAEIFFYAFDLLYLEGQSLVQSMLGERKALLQELLKQMPDGGPVRFSEHFTVSGEKLLASACEMGLEGIVSKRIDKPYRPGRRDDWIKAKCIQSDEFVIAGYLDSTAVAESVGALVLGYYERGKLIYAGRAGTGFTRATAAELWRAMQPMRSATEPFATRLNAQQRRDVVWVEPKLVAQVEYRTWTGDGLLRHAAFKALRADKPAKDVRKPA